MWEDFISTLLQDGQAGLGVFNPVPFCQHIDKATAFAGDQIGNLQVLLLESLVGIHHQKADFGKPNGAQRIGNRQRLKLFLYFGLTPHPGGIHQANRPPVPHPIHADGVARDPGFRPRQQALFANKRIDKSRLTRIWPSDDRDPQRQISLARCDVGEA